MVKAIIMVFAIKHNNCGLKDSGLPDHPCGILMPNLYAFENSIDAVSIESLSALKLFTQKDSKENIRINSYNWLERL